MTTILNIRQLPQGVGDRFRRGATARGLTQAEYLEKLLALHDAIRARADASDDGLKTELESMGLQGVSV